MLQLPFSTDSSLVSALPCSLLQPLQLIRLQPTLSVLSPLSVPVREEAEDAYDLAKDYHTTVMVRKFKALFNAYDKQVERRKIQDTNLLTLIMLYLTRASIDRLKFGFAAQYAGVGSSGMALVKLLLISHRPPPRSYDHHV